MKTLQQIQLSIVFLNYNRLEETRYTVERLLEMTRGRSDIEIIGVDNNSKDGTAEFLEKQNDIHSILLPDNSGIAGYNEGFKQAAGKYIMVLDDDSCPRDIETLDLLITLLDENTQIGVIACHVETPAGAPQWEWHLPKEHCFGISPFFIGCGFAIRRDLFEKIHWYPGEFFIYQNEIDVSFKVRMEGFEIYYHPDCRVIHRGVLSARGGWRRVYYSTRNTIWLIKKYYPQPMAAYMLLSRFLFGLGRALYLRQLTSYWKAVKDAYGKPINRRLLSPEIRRKCSPFWRQNSIFHQIFRMI
ncbi:MAG TPA: glycosyltransferase [Deltaproteobacteria bacterium]|nr:glycosyltransferase [Deltaproteobacteria bacterium]